VVVQPILAAVLQEEEEPVAVAERMQHLFFLLHQASYWALWLVLAEREVRELVEEMVEIPIWKTNLTQYSLEPPEEQEEQEILLEVRLLEVLEEHKPHP
jgi:hypothetical protein